MDTHKIHTLQTEDTPLLAAGFFILEAENGQGL
jgi:hypothetical protein